ncbi:tripartite tricarboxylate transporter TctB family protein [Comamonas endophytica]|uniref:Tripartite tricarboxylate transporter TctB family protein n=1 Tax=Comamonas endophytica TaxID=2949090 RepID=A0ABY6G8G1_9BURK|nr:MULTISPECIES: tripartite tricarboxylate transporter TctB family protein [unclassified Acidovorax]MCD2514024.1 tripartite tricarboxylate transporter TctB family protein [Acidovorax sp. D4N7]UYG51171.1 tripartite tricarboxylate transporter TctB family protein [Acidovorax sp. 5MLIR]
MTDPSPLHSLDIPPPDTGAIPAVQLQTAVGAGVLLVAAGLAFGALQIPGDAGYGGVGPNFLPWVCAAVLALCGAWLVWEALSGGFRAMAVPTGSHRADWPAAVWVSAGLLLNAALITTLGFILSCTLCYVLAVQGLRRAAGQPQAGQLRTWGVDLFSGLCISAPVFWVFTQFLAINLPGLTGTGWL